MSPFKQSISVTLRHYAGNLRKAHDDFRMAHFMYSLPKHMRADLGWPEIRDTRDHDAWR